VVAQGFEETRRIPSFARQAVLKHVIARVEQRRDELARVVAIEAGKRSRTRGAKSPA